MHRRRWRPGLAIHALAVLGLVACATRGAGPPAAISASDAETIDGLFADYTVPKGPGAAVAVVVNGRVAFSRGYGLANIGTNTAVTEHTTFRLASLTKAFTAMAIMVLVDEGRLDLEAHVQGILSDFPSYGRDITVRHLLTHTSGLPPYQKLVPDLVTRQMTDRDALILLRRAGPIQFAPGSAFRYGDSGYAMLALVVEAVSKKPFARFVHDRIFARADMTSTTFYEPGLSVGPHRALGYSVTTTGVQLADQSATSAVLGDGGIYSSVRDLAAWDRALDDHTLVSARLQQIAWTPARLSDGTRAPYGFGWFVDGHASGVRLSHHGETSGFNHFILKYPKRRLTVVILTNRRSGTPRTIAAAIAELRSLRPGTTASAWSR
jgi:CubicO group peptidase (beta-lactamase class C family)